MIKKTLSWIDPKNSKVIKKARIPILSMNVSRIRKRNWWLGVEKRRDIIPSIASLKKIILTKHS
jgi:hypothetical protein